MTAQRAVRASEQLVRFDWVDDPDAEPATCPCPHCGADCKALRIEPDRSASYMREIYLCTGDGCKRAWPRYGARAMVGVTGQ